MCASETAPPNQKVTPSEILAAIEQLCNKRGSPVVRSKDIADLDDIPVGTQAVNEHLDTLKEEGKVSSLPVQRSAVYWVSEGHYTGGEVDISAVDWDSIDPEQIPTEKIEQHPDYGEQGHWDDWADDAESALRLGMWGALMGVVALVILQNTPIEATQTRTDFAVIALLGGFLLTFAGLLLLIVRKIAMILNKRGITGASKALITATKSRVVRSIPISVSIEWKNNNNSVDMNPDKNK
jgi:hypothetical protein